MSTWRIGLILIAGLTAAHAAVAADSGSSPVRTRHGARATRTPPPATAADQQPLHDLLKGSPDQRAAERDDNDRATLKPADHRKDEFFSDWRGLR